MIERVYPSVSLDVTVKVIVPEAVPFVLGAPKAENEPWELVSVIVCPTVRLAAYGMPKEQPRGPDQLEWSVPDSKSRPLWQAV